MAEGRVLKRACAPPDERYLLAATEAARRLADAAVTIGSTVAWEGDDLAGASEPDLTLARGPVGPGMYSGTAGIGWFLAHAAPVAGDERMAQLAIGALRAAVDSAHDHVDDPGRLSLAEGASGIALAAVEAGAALGCDPLREQGLGLARRVAAAFRHRLDEIGETDLLGGVAGIVVALLAVQRRFPDAALSGACREACRRLAGLRPEREAPPALCGLAHGASGPAWALTEMAAHEAGPLFPAAARRLFDYERSRFSAERCAWPDLREAHRAGSETGWPAWTTAWCHGALGIGAVRLRTFEATRDRNALAEASAAIQAARAMAAEAAAALRDGAPADVSLCHGLGGAAELLLLAHEVTGEPDHLRAARRVGDLCLRMRAANGDRWTCGLRGATDVPGLFLGQAGVGATFLRLHDPRRMGSPALPGRPPLELAGTSGLRAWTARRPARRTARPRSPVPAP